MSSSSNYDNIRVFAIGNPLLDISVPVSAEFLSERNLELDRAYLFEIHESQDFVDAAGRELASYSLGGSSLNTCRALQQILRERDAAGTVNFLGCIGDDENGAELRRQAGQALSGAHFCESAKGQGTGICGAFLCDKSRTFCAALGAARDLSISALDEPCAKAAFDEAQVIYICSFAASDYAETALELARRANAAGKLVALNISSPLMCTAFTPAVLALVEQASVVMGNMSEYAALAGAAGWIAPSDDSEDDDEAVAEEVFTYIERVIGFKSDPAAKPVFKQLAGGRLVVVTNGSGPSFVGSERFGTSSFPVPFLPREEIVDSNGAGDAFCAGFLCELAADCAVWKSADAAAVAAAEDEDTFYKRMDRYVSNAHGVAVRCLRHAGAQIGHM